MNQITIGRDSQSTIVVPAQYSTVSGAHATITKSGNAYSLEDHSKNGTYVNGKHIHNSSCPVRLGDRITLGPEYVLNFSEVLKYLDSSLATQRIPVTPGTARVDAPLQEQYATPACLNDWNWGAFLLGWIWGVGNGIYWPIVMLIPVIGQLAALVIIFVLGVNGNRYAWAVFKGTADEFDKKQQIWTKAGWIFFIASIILSLFTALLVRSF